MKVIQVSKHALIFSYSLHAKSDMQESMMVLNMEWRDTITELSTC